MDTHYQSEIEHAGYIGIVPLRCSSATVSSHDDNPLLQTYLSDCRPFLQLNPPSGDPYSQV